MVFFYFCILNQMLLSSTTKDFHIGHSWFSYRTLCISYERLDCKNSNKLDEKEIWNEVVVRDLLVHNTQTTSNHSCVVESYCYRAITPDFSLFRSLLSLFNEKSGVQLIIRRSRRQTLLLKFSRAMESRNVLAAVAVVLFWDG